MDKTLALDFFGVRSVVALTVLLRKVGADILRHYLNILLAVRLAHFPCCWDAARESVCLDAVIWATFDWDSLYNNNALAFSCQD